MTERDIEEELAASGLSEDEMGRVTILKTAEARRSLALLSAARFGYPAVQNDYHWRDGNKGKDHHHPYDKKPFLKRQEKGGDDRHHRHGDQWTGDPYHEYHAGIL